MNIYEYMNFNEAEKPLDNIVTDGGFCSIFRSIACIGDSLSSGEFESIDSKGQKQYHDFYEYSWGQFIGRSCGSTVYNFSMGGMTAKDYIEQFADKKGFWGRDKLCQAYIIALGVNDIVNQGHPLGSIDDICVEDYTKNALTFAGYYAQIIQRIQELQPRAKIFIVSIPKSGNEKDELRKEHRDLLNAFTKFFKNTYLVDLYTYSPTQDADFKKKFWLGHMTPTGYVLMARMIESYIDYKTSVGVVEKSEVLEWNYILPETSEGFGQRTGLFFRLWINANNFSGFMGVVGDKAENLSRVLVLLLQVFLLVWLLIVKMYGLCLLRKCKGKRGRIETAE